MGQTITVGDKAPDFTLKDQDQNDVTLSSFQSKKNVVLAFYPLDFRPVCSKEHSCFRDDLKEFEKLKRLFCGNCNDEYSSKILSKKVVQNPDLEAISVSRRDVGCISCG